MTLINYCTVALQTGGFFFRSNAGSIYKSLPLSCTGGTITVIETMSSTRVCSCVALSDTLTVNRENL